MFTLTILISLAFFGFSADGSLLNQKDYKYLDHIKSYSTEDVQAQAANEVIQRAIPNHAHFFEVEINFKLKSHTFRLLKNDTVQVVLIEASSGVAACKGFYHYLKYYCDSHISWDGNNIQIPAHLPNVDVTETSLSRFIYYQNVCTWSYSFAWWKWDDWQKHIDWIAMQGITLTLAPVQELVWEKVYLQLGLTKKEIDDHFAGPGFFAWQRMGNLRGWAGPLTSNFKKASSVLQKRIIASLRALGISVALPAFAGHVPVAFKRIFPNASLTPAERWNGFPDEFCCPLYVDPADEIFDTIGTLFLQNVIEEYGGTNHIYFSDPFNEMEPRLNTPKYLSDASEGIFRAITSVDSKAVWLLQAWMFVKNPFWSDELIKAFLTAVPKGRILVLDLQSEFFPQYERTYSFHGQPFIWCLLHNFGGTQGMHGSLDVVNEDILKVRKMKNYTMAGVGITPEGINQNYVMYDFALDRGWYQNSINIDKWLQRYTLTRYKGLNSDFITSGWHKLYKSVYSYRGIIKIGGRYTVCRRPSINISPWIWYNRTIIDDVLYEFLQVPENLTLNNDLFRHDLVDVTRQAIQIKVDVLYIQIIDSFRKKDLKNLEQLTNQFEDLLLDLDSILKTSEQFLLGRWLESAKGLATNKLEAQNYEFNARNQITLWGPTGEIVDYAVKQWAGLVGDYCLPRWQFFFKELIRSLRERNGKFNNNECKQKIFKEIEEPFGVSNVLYDPVPKGDSFNIAKEIFEKWKNV